MRCRDVLLLMATFVPGIAPAAGFSGILDGTLSQGCFTTFDTCTLVGSGVASNVPSWEISTPHYSSTSVRHSPFYPDETLTADSQLVASFSPGSMHAYATSGISVQSPNPDIRFNDAGAYTSVTVDAVDHLTFSSPTLPQGTDISFDLTGILHSVIAADQPSNCALGSDAFAEMVIQAGGRVDTLDHTTCGQGSDLMSVTHTFHTKLGDPDFGILTGFAVTTNAAVQGPYEGAFRQTVDASHTGSIVINVLTPGVTFTSGSGYAYAAPVPEPESLLLMASGLAALVSLRRRPRRH